MCVHGAGGEGGEGIGTWAGKIGLVNHSGATAYPVKAVREVLCTRQKYIARALPGRHEEPGAAY